MQKLANSKESKVPYDAQDNRNTTEYVHGLIGILSSASLSGA